MPADGLFLKKLTNELNILQNGRINKILEISDNDFIFQIRSNHINYNLLISISQEYNRIHLTNKEYDHPPHPKAFTMLLRKYFEGNIINSIYSYKNDRTIIIETQGNNEIGDLERKKIILELMGRYSNMIILKDNRIIQAYRYQNSIENKRFIIPNASFEFLESDKIDPTNLSLNEIDNIFADKNITTSKEISNTFIGLSPFISNIIINDKYPAKKLYDIINCSIVPSIFKNNNKDDFYFINYIDNNKVFDTLSQMLDEFYYNKALKERIKQKTNDLGLFVTRQINKLKTKIVKLDEDYLNASKSDLYRIYGEILLTSNELKKKLKEVTILNYYDNTMITIPLDNKYDVLTNSNLYFKKYQKSKNAISHINQQKEIAINELEYFNLINNQIQIASINDILQIQEELYQNKYINNLNKKKQKKEKIKLLTYIIDDNTKILVGKNNIQNEIITHKISKPNDLWFHIKDAPGSHVLLKKEGEISEYDIRTCANIAALFSPSKDSSSVCVNYTMARYIKKIPGKRNCFVTYTNEKSIYIDPDNNLINNIKTTYTLY